MVGSPSPFQISGTVGDLLASGLLLSLSQNLCLATSQVATDLFFFFLFFYFFSFALCVLVALMRVCAECLRWFGGAVRVRKDGRERREEKFWNFFFFFVLSP